MLIFLSFVSEVIAEAVHAEVFQAIIASQFNTEKTIQFSLLLRVLSVMHHASGFVLFFPCPLFPIWPLSGKWIFPYLSALYRAVYSEYMFIPIMFDTQGKHKLLCCRYRRREREVAFQRLKTPISHCCIQYSYVLWNIQLPSASFLYCGHTDGAATRKGVFDDRAVRSTSPSWFAVCYSGWSEGELSKWSKPRLSL